MACGILVPKPGIEPMPPEVDVQSLNHWIAREVPIMIFKINSSFFFFFYGVSHDRNHFFRLESESLRAFLYLCFYVI